MTLVKVSPCPFDEGSFCIVNVGPFGIDDDNDGVIFVAVRVPNKVRDATSVCSRSGLNP